MPLPAIVTALATHGLSLIGNAILAKGKEEVEKRLGVEIPDNPSPEKVLELQTLQIKHAEFLVSTALQETQAFLADTQSARARDAEVIKAQGRNVRGDNLAYGAIFALLVCIILLFVADVPRGSRDLLLVVLGALVAIVKDVYGFEFGASKGSERNAQAVADMLKNGHE